MFLVGGYYISRAVTTTTPFATSSTFKIEDSLLSTNTGTFTYRVGTTNVSGLPLATSSTAGANAFVSVPAGTCLTP